MPYVTSSSPSNYSVLDRLLVQPTSDVTSHVSLSHPSAVAASSHSFTLYMRPPYERAIADVIKHYKWSKIFYMYDTNEGRWHLGLLTLTWSAKHISFYWLAIRTRKIVWEFFCNFLRTGCQDKEYRFVKLFFLLCLLRWMFFQIQLLKTLMGFNPLFSNIYRSFGVNQYFMTFSCNQLVSVNFYLWKDVESLVT